jgi:hypothetical protein
VCLETGGRLEEGEESGKRESDEEQNDAEQGDRFGDQSQRGRGEEHRHVEQAQVSGRVRGSRGGLIDCSQAAARADAP